MNKFRYRLGKIKHRIENKLLVERRKISIRQKQVSMFPTTIQLPLTHLCNFDCVMCGMHHMINRADFTHEELKDILSDELFKKVENVGINGGEPFLKKDFIECCKAMIDTLPLLGRLNIISNGYCTERILYCLKELKQMTNSKGIKVHLSLSVDGIGDMQDFHRGHKSAFQNVNNTLDALLQSTKDYVDGVNIICTITKYNISRINEVELWAQNKGVKVAYNIATENVRIENQDKINDFSIFSDEHKRMLAQEFFYKKYLDENSERYFAIYLFLKEQIRYAMCPCMYNEWITLTPDCQLGFCATHSKNLGSALENSAYGIVQNNLKYLEELKLTYCSNCSHYIYRLNDIGLKKMLDDKFINAFYRGY